MSNKNTIKGNVIYKLINETLKTTYDWKKM